MLTQKPYLFVCFCIVGIFLNSTVIDAQHLTLKAAVQDTYTDAPISDVLILEKVTGKGTTSGTEGTFTLRLDKGNYILHLSCLGYSSEEYSLVLSGDTTLTITLTPSRFSMEEITVTGELLKDRISSPVMGSYSLSKRDIAAMPSLLGEPDPLKLLQYTPGIQSGSTGGAGYYVRGGGVDQNAVLFDQTLVYNPGHLLGIFSVFNSDFVREAEVLHAGIPANYGGKISSVFKIHSYKGNRDSLEFRGNIGAIFSKFSVNGPISEKATFNIGIRRTYIGLVVKPVMALLSESTSFLNHDNRYNFYDMNAGFSFQPTENDYIHLQGYYGRDDYRILREDVAQDHELDWGNRFLSLLWIHRFGKNGTWNTSLSRTAYDFGFSGRISEYTFGVHSGMSDFHLKSEGLFMRGNHTITVGIENTEHRFMPHQINAESGEFKLDFPQVESSRGWEGGIYMQDEFELSEKLILSAGIRYSFYNRHGPARSYIRNTVGEITDSIDYSWYESLAFYDQMEPRLLIHYQLNERSFLKASYMRMAQYVHLATSTSASLPLNIWVSSSNNVQPMTGDQVSLGYYRSLGKKMFDFSAELYYKHMANKPEFLRGILFSSVTGDFYDNIVQGTGRSYGMELFFSAETERLKGWLGYSLSKSENRFEMINDGNFFPAKYDRTHDLSSTGLVHLNAKWDLSASFIFMTGNVYTVPVSRYIIQGNIYNHYGMINSYRMPSTHRLDLSLKRSLYTKRGLYSELVFTIYNVYNHENPLYIYYEITGGEIENYELQVQAFHVNLLPVIPSVSWNFVF